MSKQQFVENVKRRDFDAAEAEKNIAERQKQELKKKNPGSQLVVRTALKARDAIVDLDAKVGTHEVITNTSSLSQRGGFYCEKCDVNLKDSTSWLNHINGKAHNANMGMTMRPERAKLSQVQERLEYHKRKMEEEAKGSVAADIEARFDSYDKEEENGNSKSKKKKNKKKEEVATEAVEIDPSMAEMGFSFSSFGGKK